MNPYAGQKKSAKFLPEIISIFNRAGYIVQIHLTAGPGDGIFAVKTFAPGKDLVICCGGDGTLHEVVNGLFIQQTVEPSEVTIGVVAVGTGNDWIRMYGLPKTYSEAIRAIKEGYTFLQDIG